MGDEERHAFGAHFTHPADIMKIVGPTIVQPWREQIEGAKTLKRLVELRDRLHHFRVLDPACGSGNFLYIAYRELKRLEAHLLERMQEFPSRAEPGQRMLSFLSAQNFYGLDIQPFAVEIAKVTMMIARKLAIDELHITEPALPLDNLDQNFIAADALITKTKTLLLQNLCADKYLNADENCPGVLRDGQVGSDGPGSAQNAYMSWGDYYLMEALDRELHHGETWW